MLNPSATPCVKEGNTSLGNVSEQCQHFLQLLGKPENAAWVRYIDPLKKRPAGADHHWFSSAQALEKLQKRQSQGFDAYLIIGNGTTATGIHKSTGKPSGAQADWDITDIPALFVEWDKKPIDWQVIAWQELGLPEPSIQVHTGGKSIHNYWVLDEPMAPAAWKVLIKRLIAHCGADTNNSNPSRLMRLPGSIYHDKETGEATANTAEIIHASERRYSAAELEACLPPVLAKAAASTRQIAAVVSRQSSDGWPPRTIEEIQAAAEYIPIRIGGEGTYKEDLRALCGCAAALTEAGYPEATAIELLGHKWPSIAAAKQVLDSTTTRKAASFWSIAAEHGYQLSRQKQVITKPVKVKTGKLVDQLPEGWELNAKGERSRRKLKTGDLAKKLKENVSDKLRFNELTLYAEYNNKTITNSELDYFYIELSEHGYTIPKKDAADCLIYQARKQSYHPIRDYLNHIKTNSDITPVDISNLASKYLNSTNPLHDTMLRKTLVGAVARVMEPGCKFDTCLVLAGATGIGKSTFFKTLASPAWFCDTPQEQSKDLKLVIHSTWIYELAELETITGKKESGEIKALLSASTDKFRAPYEKAMEDHDRKSILVATCNRRDFLRDETGSRRYWVIPVPNAMHEKIDVTGLLLDRDAIWKAAVLAYANGEKPFLDIQDELSSEQENKAYEPEDIWLAPMDRWLRHLLKEPVFTTDEALVGSGLRQRDHLSSDDQRRAAHVLRELGCVQEKLQTRVQGKRARLWKVGTNASDVSDQNKGSETGQNNCAGTDHSVLSQISDKKSKSFEFLSLEGIEPPPPAPSSVNRESFRKRSEYLRQNAETCCAGTDFAVSDPLKRSETTPTSETGIKPLNASDSNAIDRNQLDPFAESGTIPGFIYPSTDGVGSGADVEDSGDDPHWPARATAA